MSSMLLMQSNARTSLGHFHVHRHTASWHFTPDPLLQLNPNRHVTQGGCMPAADVDSSAHTRP